MADQRSLMGSRFNFVQVRMTEHTMTTQRTSKILSYAGFIPVATDPVPGDPSPLKIFRFIHYRGHLTFLLCVKTLCSDYTVRWAQLCLELKSSGRLIFGNRASLHNFTQFTELLSCDSGLCHYVKCQLICYHGISFWIKNSECVLRNNR